MEQKLILFQGGTHGNFLTRYLNVQEGFIDAEHSFYDNLSYGAHSSAITVWHTRADKEKIKYVCGHDNRLIEKVFCYVYVKKDDLYKLNWHNYYASGEFGLNLLNNTKEFLIDFYNFLKLKSSHPVAVNSNIKYFEKSSNGLREYFKTSFKKSNGFLLEQEKIIRNYKIENYFYFKDFYSNNFDQKIKENLNIDVTIKTDHHRIFLERKKSIIESEIKVKSAVNAFINKQRHNLEDFCLYEQAYFDHLIEEHYGITLKTFYEQYPIDTLEYVVREDK